jgi:hypothetical protein
MAGEGLGPLERAEKKKKLLEIVREEIVRAEDLTEGRKANAILRILHHLVETIEVDL